MLAPHQRLLVELSELGITTGKVAYFLGCSRMAVWRMSRSDSAYYNEMGKTLAGRLAMFSSVARPRVLLDSQQGSWAQTTDEFARALNFFGGADLVKQAGINRAVTYRYCASLGGDPSRATVKTRAKYAPLMDAAVRERFRRLDVVIDNFFVSLSHSTQ